MDDDMICPQFIELMRVALGNAKRLDVTPTPKEWEELFAMSVRQGLVGVMFDGVERLPKEQMPPVEMIMDWAAAEDYLAKENRRLNKACVEVCERFEQDGVRVCILKGQGMSVLYPKPLRRATGDIDVWMQGGKEQVVEYMRSHYEQVEGPNMYHVATMLKNGVEMEVHYRPVRLSSPKRDERLRKWMEEMEPKQWNHWAELPEGVGKIRVPSKNFDLVFILLHLLHHWAFEGCGMKQLVDYYWLMMSASADERREAMETLSVLGLGNFVAAVMYIFSLWGMEDGVLLCPPSKWLGTLLLDDIMKVGVVSADDLSVGVYGQEKKVRKFWRRLTRMCRLMPLAPHELPRVWWDNVWWWMVRKMK